MPSVVRRPAALEDALAIWLYIASDDIDAADRLAIRLDGRILSLAEMPLAGQARPELGDRLRSVAVGNYLIFYEPLPDGIEVVRILHGARDVQKASFD